MNTYEILTEDDVKEATSWTFEKIQERMQNCKDLYELCDKEAAALATKALGPNGPSIIDENVLRDLSNEIYWSIRDHDLCVTALQQDISEGLGITVSMRKTSQELNEQFKDMENKPIFLTSPGDYAKDFAFKDKNQEMDECFTCFLNPKYTD